MAALAAGLILFLLVASACPRVHGLCCNHAHPGATADAGCIVFGFANGVVSAAGAVTVSGPAVFIIEVAGIGASPAALASPAWRVPPACGPPAAA